MLSYRKELRKFKCHPDIQIYAFTNHPYYSRQTISYRVTEITANGFTLIGIIPDGLSPIGASAKLKVLIPYFGEFKVKVASTNYSPVEDDDLRQNFAYSLSVEFINPSYSLLQALSSYLMLELGSDYGLRTLLKNGFLVPNLNSAIQFQTFFLDKMNQHEEKIWNEILELRLRASQKSGRWKGETDFTKLIDNYDKYSCHIVGTVCGKIVGSIRIVFNNNVIERVEHAKITEIPKFLWEDGFAESSRMSINPRYQGINLFAGIMDFTIQTFIQHGFNHALMNCADYLIPEYKEYGAYEMGVRFNTKYMQGTTLNLISIDRVSCALGKKLSPRVWYAHWKDWYFYCAKNKSISPTISDKIRIFCYHNIIGFIAFKYREYQTAKNALRKRTLILDKFKSS